MSSKYVRDTMVSHITAALPTEKVLDISGESQNIQDFLSANNVKHTDNWIGLTFTGGDETPVSLTANNVQGVYREIGAVEIYVVSKSKPGIAGAIIIRADAIVNALRGQRIGDIIIESIVQPNFGTGGTLDFEAGMTSALVLCSYQRDLAI